ncbi:MAG: saccharopine dehydrogenase NADP-binding domain-containing protein [Alphaproteobacteria bacterium]|nr:saccharopine dehydrogenase NADP-binding domain-containing protein [Alphaproteobacteria bacterium]
MARIIILCGGRQGRIIANDLAGDHDVNVADIAAVNISGVRSIQQDLSRPLELVGILREYDVVVGALPARLGFAAAQAAVKAERHYVDLSFYIEDVAQLHGAAEAAGVAIMPDCGLAPGLSNLIAGRALATRTPQEINIQVGGFAADPKKPYGYVITWSPEDIPEEYQRPARTIRDGKIVEVPALSGLEIINIPGVGEVEAFFTDGLRTLLSEANPPVGVPRINNMTEKTLRWPGHVKAVKPLIASGTLVTELTEKCREGADLVVFRLQVDGEVVTMVDRARGGISAMARTTALTCAAVARWVAAGKMQFTGVVPPEKLAIDHAAYRFILDTLRVRGVAFDPPYPFM